LIRFHIVWNSLGQFQHHFRETRLRHQALLYSSPVAFLKAWELDRLARIEQVSLSHRSPPLPFGLLLLLFLLTLYRLQVVLHLVLECLLLLLVVLDKRCVVPPVPVRLNSWLERLLVLVSDVLIKVLYSVKSRCKSGLVEPEVVTRTKIRLVGQPRLLLCRR